MSGATNLASQVRTGKFKRSIVVLLLLFISHVNEGRCWRSSDDRWAEQSWKAVEPVCGILREYFLNSEPEVGFVFHHVSEKRSNRITQKKKVVSLYPQTKHDS